MCYSFFAVVVQNGQGSEGVGYLPTHGQRAHGELLHMCVQCLKPGEISLPLIPIAAQCFVIDNVYVCVRPFHGTVRLLFYLIIDTLTY